MIHPKKKLCPCVCVRLILALVLGRQTVYGQKTVYLCLSTYIVLENTHTHSNVRVTTKALACNCWGTDRHFDSLRRRASQVSRVLLYSSNSSGVFVGRVLDSSQRYLLLRGTAVSPFLYCFTMSWWVNSWISVELQLCCCCRNKSRVRAH